MKSVNILTLCLAMGISMCDDASASDGPLGVIGDEGFQLLERLFEYDDDVPLDALVLESRDLTHGKRHKILYSGLWRSRVPAYLEIPHDVGPPYPCVVLFHKLTDSKEQWWPMIDSLEGRHRDRLVSEGMAVFAIGGGAGKQMQLRARHLGRNPLGPEVQKPTQRAQRIGREHSLRWWRVGCWLGFAERIR